VSEPIQRRESVGCPVCGADIGTPCSFPNGGPWTITEDGVARRVVHAGRYARTLSESEAATFWNSAVEKYLGQQLGARVQVPDDLDDDPRLWTEP
jgi:hypothetical protein